MNERLRVLTWHIHGNYLYYLSQTPHEFFVPYRPGGVPRYFGRSPSFSWPDNLHEVAAEEVRRLDFDCVLFQHSLNYLEDQYEILSEDQRRLPKIYLEHDPPREHPTDTRHVVNDDNILLVHVTPFNNLMWDSGRTPTRVIEHGVVVPPEVRYTGEIPRGLAIVNNLSSRGRRLGADVFEYARQRVPLDLVGIGSEEMGGLGEIPPMELPAFAAQYRFLFNPIRYTSLGLAVCEAMAIGMPIVGLATTEMVTVIDNDVSGYIDTDVDRLVALMMHLVNDSGDAQRLGEGARRAAARFRIERFAADWSAAFADVAGRGPLSQGDDLVAARKSA